jgi:hypothetical protein
MCRRHVAASLIAIGWHGRRWAAALIAFLAGSAARLSDTGFRFPIMTGILVVTSVGLIWQTQVEVRESRRAVQGMIAMKSLMLRVNAGDPVEEAEFSDRALGDLASVVKEAVALRERNVQRLQHIEGSPAAQRFGSALKVANLRDRSRVAEGRQAVASFVSALEQAQSEILADRDALSARIEKETRDSRYGSEVVASVADTTEEYKTAIIQYIEAYQGVARAVDRVLVFLDNAQGRYSVRDERVVFAREEDLAHYQAMVLNVTQSAATLGKALANSQAHVRERVEKIPWQFDAQP